MRLLNVFRSFVPATPTGIAGDNQKVVAVRAFQFNFQFFLWQRRNVKGALVTERTLHFLFHAKNLFPLYIIKSTGEKL